MTTSKFLNILLALTLIILIFKFSSDNSTGLDQREATLKTIHSRKSVRKFTTQEVSKSDLETIMKAGMAAPSGHDTRLWQFIVLTERDKMMALRKELVWATGLDTSTVAIVVCGDMSKVDERNPEFWLTDTSAATQNMLLAIESMGLGGVWCTLYPGEKRMSHARKVLDLPEHIMPMCVIPIGYPAGENRAKDKYDPTTIHWNKW